MTGQFTRDLHYGQRVKVDYTCNVSTSGSTESKKSGFVRDAIEIAGHYLNKIPRPFRTKEGDRANTVIKRFPAVVTDRVNAGDDLRSVNISVFPQGYEGFSIMTYAKPDTIH